MGFTEIFEQASPEFIEQSIYSSTDSDVLSALRKTRKLGLKDFAALLSPVADGYLDVLANRSQQITQRRFGKTIQLYVPLYLSNECQNICTYCGFSFHNKIPRKTLNDVEILEEAQILAAKGFKHILLVTGESYRTVGVEYIEQAIRLLRPLFAQVSIEVQPLSSDDYKRLRRAGLHAVYVYQETYDKEAYAKHHPKGKKSNMEYRLQTPERLGEAGVHKIGLGVLLGLSDWRVDSWYTALHLSYLRKKYWRSKYSISFPRLRPAEGVEESRVSDIDERKLLQLICAYRLFDENVELSLSTRERAAYRDLIFPLGITSMSAESSTEPGGYSKKSEALEQFSVDDTRSAQEVAGVISQKGYEVIWKDWDESFEVLRVT